MSQTPQDPQNPPPDIRRATADDLQAVVQLDARVTGRAKPEYWADIFERFGTRRQDKRFFLLADGGEGLAGLIAGEVRGWEFGSEPCGWVFAVSVDPEQRERHIGEQLFHEICARFRAAGIRKVRNMVRREDQLLMSFFRSEGMVAGPYIQLELNLDDAP